MPELSCPNCGQDTPLIALGVRGERPHRWRPWVTALTLLYLCDRCDALIEARQPAHDATAQTEMRGVTAGHPA